MKTLSLFSSIPFFVFLFLSRRHQLASISPFFQIAGWSPMPCHLFSSFLANSHCFAHGLRRTVTEKPWESVVSVLILSSLWFLGSSWIKQLKSRTEAVISKLLSSARVPSFLPTKLHICVLNICAPFHALSLYSKLYLKSVFTVASVDFYG